MPGRALQAFLSSIFDIAVERCGKQFAGEVISLRRERERLLGDSWRELPPEDLPPSGQEGVFREIDFDTVVTHAARYLEQKDYLAFLFDIAEVATGSAEFEKAHRLLDLIGSRYYRSAHKSLLAKTHQKLADIAFYQNNLQEANGEYRQSLKLYEVLGDSEGITSIKNSVASLMVEQGKTSQGESLFLEAKELAVANKFVPLLAKINCNLGNLYLMHGAWEKSMSCYEEALANNPDVALQARIHHNMAIVHKWQEDYPKATENLDRSIRFSSDANDPYQKGLSYLEKADVSCRGGDFSSATALATTAFQIFSELGERLGIAEVYRIFGMINRDSKRFDVAFSYFENSIRINEDYNNALNLGETLNELAQFYVQRGEPEKAIENLRSSLRYFKQVQARAKMALVEEAIATLA